MSYLVKILLVKLKNLYIQHAWILNMKKQNNNQKWEGWKDGSICQNFDHYHHVFSFGHTFSCKRIWNLTLD